MWRGEGLVALTIRQLGPPAIERDGEPAVPPRGRKAWALLAYLLLAERPPGRRHLAELLFGDAEDPLGALRWTLAELRRALGAPALFRGDPVATALGPGPRVDVLALLGRRPTRPRCWSSTASCWTASTWRPARRSSPGWWWSATGSRPRPRRGCARRRWRCWRAGRPTPRSRTRRGRWPATRWRRATTSCWCACALDAATAHRRAHPEDGRTQDRTATVVVEQGLRCRATDPLGHAATTDMPPELGGADTAPTPGTLFRMAVGSCAATTLAMRAAQEGIPLTGWRSSWPASPTTAACSASTGSRPAPCGCGCATACRPPGVPAARLRALVDWAERHSPAAATTRRQLPVTVEVDLSGA
jgi:organic hydroperoxide reductase OsmC/OhrA